MELQHVSHPARYQLAQNKAFLLTRSILLPLLPHDNTAFADLQGFGRVEGYQKGAQGSGSGGSGSAGNPPSFQSGSGSGSYSQSGNTGSGSGYESGARSGNQPGLGSGSSNKYNAGQALADQGVADQAAFVGSKTLGHHNVPDNYEKEAPVLPGQQEYSSAHSGQSTGGQSTGGQAGGARSTTSSASTQVCSCLSVAVLQKGL